MRSCGLVIMDAGPLIKLALARELDLLLRFGVKVYIPDEICFEAVEKRAWERGEELAGDKIYLRDWINAAKSNGLVSVPDTLIGEIAKKKRASGEYTPAKKNHRKNTGELAAPAFFNNRDEWGHPGEPAILLTDDGPGIEKIRIENLDAYVLTTYAMLVAFQEAGIIASSQGIWQKIADALPSAAPLDVSESLRGTSELKSKLRPG